MNVVWPSRVCRPNRGPTLSGDSQADVSKSTYRHHSEAEKRKKEKNKSKRFFFVSFFLFSSSHLGIVATNQPIIPTVSSSKEPSQSSTVNPQESKLLSVLQSVYLSIHDKTMTKHLDIAHDPGEKLLWPFLPFLFIFFYFFSF